MVRLTHDHKPSDPREKERILKCGGTISQPALGRPRVNGVLDMSRSIGDVELKSVGVTCEPDTRSIQVPSTILFTSFGLHHVKRSLMS